MELEQLVNPKRLDEVKRSIDKSKAKMSHAEWLEYRWLAKNNLFYLANSILNYKRLSRHLHAELCDWMSSSAKDRFRLILLPRGHFKSTLCTIAHCVQLALPDDTEKLPWPYNLGPNIKILLAHEIHESASRFLGAIQEHFLANEKLLTLFPELLYDSDKAGSGKPKLNKFEFGLPRTEASPEPTFDTIGVGGKVQSRHYNFIKLDDLIGKEARDSKAVMQNAKDWFDNVQSLFSAFTADHFDLIGTRWLYDDLYAHAQEVYGKNLSCFTRGFYTNNKIGPKVPIFPEEFTEESVAQLKRSPRIWTAQYLNDPREGDSGFNTNWLRYFYWTKPKELCYFEKTLFQTSKLGDEVRYNTQDLDICFLVDPALNGLTAFLATGMDRRGRIFTLDAVKKSMKPEELINLIFQKVLYWQPRIVGIESVNFSALYQNWFIREQSLRSIRFRIEPLKTRNKEKEARITALNQYFESGLVYVNETQEDLIKEFHEFGATDNVHLLDAMAHGPQIWRNFTGLKSTPSNAATAASILARRNPLTGY